MLTCRGSDPLLNSSQFIRVAHEVETLYSAAGWERKSAFNIVGGKIPTFPAAPTTIQPLKLVFSPKSWKDPSGMAGFSKLPLRIRSNFKTRLAINRESLLLKYRPNRNGVRFATRFSVGHLRDFLLTLALRKS